MKRKVKQGGLYQYLEQLGILASGTDAEIKEAKRHYWTMYKATWRKRHRQVSKEIRIQLNDSDLKAITVAAKKHKRSKAIYIKEAALAYYNGRFLVPDVLLVGEIRQLLAMAYTLLHELKSNEAIPYKKQLGILQEFEALEHKILSLLVNPPSLEASIIQVIQNAPSYKQVLYKLIQSQACDT